MHIRRMTVDDIDSVVKVERSSFPTPWERHAFEYEMEKNDAAYYLVCEIDGEVVAHCGAWFVIDQGTITNIAVMPDYRGRGIGRLLLQEVLDYCDNEEIESISLEVRVSNKVAIRLYEKMGFVKGSIRKNYYADNNEDAILMYMNL